MQIKKLTLVGGLLIFGAGAALAQQNGLVMKESAHDVIETADRLEMVLAEKGITVFARFDHAENARKVDMELGPTELLVFGNPNLGTPLMQAAPTMGIDLPMKALVFEDENGQVWLTYNDPTWLATRHGISGQDEILSKMGGALDQLTSSAVAE
jgi:uncharacterized protein (DUF302 family)